VLSDILEPEAPKLVRDWFFVEHFNMVATSSFGPTVRRAHGAVSSLGFGQAIEPHEAHVIGQGQFLVHARGFVWDCRAFALGLPAVPMDFSAALASDLKNDFIRSSLLDWLDQELVSFLLGGVKIRADLPLEFLFMPHPGSISDSWDSAQGEIWQLTNFDYNDLHHVIPFAPCCFAPQGSTPRKLEPARFRHISDGGALRKVLTFTHSLIAVSLAP
jgi:hypothetical protein